MVPLLDSTADMRVRVRSLRSFLIHFYLEWAGCVGIGYPFGDRAKRWGVGSGTFCHETPLSKRLDLSNVGGSCHFFDYPYFLFKIDN